MEDNYIEEFKNIIEKFNKIKNGAHKADLFRYYYLYINGGIFIDSDAMIEIDMKNIVKNYNFFSFQSIHSNMIFQGFIGCTPKNIIIYKALHDIYNINIDELQSNYFLIVSNLFNIIKNNPNDGTHLYNERHHNNSACVVYNETNDIILFHYWKHKIIPK